MRILLLNPPFKTEKGRFSRASRSPGVSRRGTVYYPIWLAYAAGVLEKEGHIVKLIDSCAYGYDIKTTYSLIKDFEPELVVLDTSTPSIYNDVNIGAEIKEILPIALVVLVGTHPSALPEETLMINKKIDVVAQGEYDYTLRDLADCLQRRTGIASVEGIVFREGEKIVHNQQRKLIENVDELPFVSAVYKEHLQPEKYFFGAAFYPMVMIITGRGCPCRCFFCVYPQTLHGRRYRLRSAENVVSEFQYIVDNFPQVKEIGIEDDTATVNVERIRQICQLIIKQKINKRITWWANVRVSLDLVTMQLMKEAGCRLVIAGFESGTQEILDNMKKGISIEQSIEFVKNTKKAGLLVHGCFMLGNPGESLETMKQTFKFAIRLDIDSAQFFPMIPYPGTEAYTWARQNSYLKNIPFNQWITDDGQLVPVMDLPCISAEKLIKFIHYARLAYFFRIKYIVYKFALCLRDRQVAKKTFFDLKMLLKNLFTN